MSEPARHSESGFLGLSIRAWLALILCTAFVVLAFVRPGLEEKLFNLTLVAVTYFFAQKPAPKPPTPLNPAP